MTLPDTYWAWVAGIIDGEGSIFVTRVRHPDTRSGWYARVKVGVTNTDIRMLDELLRSGGSVSGPSTTGQGKVRRPFYRWRAGATWLRECGGLVQPYLVTKEPQMRVALSLLGAPQEDITAAREVLCEMNIGAERMRMERTSWS